MCRVPLHYRRSALVLCGDLSYILAQFSYGLSARLIHVGVHVWWRVFTSLILDARVFPRSFSVRTHFKFVAPLSFTLVFLGSSFFDPLFSLLRSRSSLPPRYLFFPSLPPRLLLVAGLPFGLCGHPLHALRALACLPCMLALEGGGLGWGEPVWGDVLCLRCVLVCIGVAHLTHTFITSEPLNKATSAVVECFI